MRRILLILFILFLVSACTVLESPLSNCIDTCKNVKIGNDCDADIRNTTGTYMECIRQQRRYYDEDCFNICVGDK